MNGVGGPIEPPEKTTLKQPSFIGVMNKKAKTKQKKSRRRFSGIAT